MRSIRCSSFVRYLFAIASVICFADTRGSAAEPPDAAQASGALAVDLQAARGIFFRQDSIRIRFFVINRTDSDQTLQYARRSADAITDGVALPVEWLLGTREQPTLWVAYENERLKPIGSQTTSGDPVRAEVRIAPNGVLGAELALAQVWSGARYPGVYRLVWRPFGEGGPQAETRFRVDAPRDAVFVTDYGKVTFALQYEAAPRNVENFLELVREGFYNGLSLHRVIPNFVISGGCPLSNGQGTRPDGRTVVGEFTDTPVEAGTLCMSHRQDDPDSASCQFFIALARLPELDGQYTVIGRVRDAGGLQTLEQIARVQTDRANRPVRSVLIRSINLIQTAESRTPRSAEIRPATGRPAPVQPTSTPRPMYPVGEAPN